MGAGVERGVVRGVPAVQHMPVDVYAGFGGLRLDAALIAVVGGWPGWLVWLVAAMCEVVCLSGCLHGFLVWRGCALCLVRWVCISRVW